MNHMNNLLNYEQDSVDLLLKDIFAWADGTNGHFNYKTLQSYQRPRRPRAPDLGTRKIDSKPFNSYSAVKCLLFTTMKLTCTIFLLMLLCFVINGSVMNVIQSETEYQPTDSLQLSVRVLNSILKPITSRDFHISSHLMNLNSYLMRLCRLVSLYFELNKWFEPHLLQGLDLDDRGSRNIMCVVSNPFYSNMLEYMCTICDGIKYILTPKFGTKPQAVSRDLFIADWPVIFRNWANKVNLQELRTSIAENSKLLDGFATNLISSVDYLRKIEDFGNEDIITRLESDVLTHIIWTTEHYRTSYILRTLFPRPQLIPQDIPVSLRNILMVDGQNAPSFKLPASKSGLMLYTQSSGSRNLVLKPKEHCITICKTFTARLAAGDIMLVNQTVWEVFSFTSGNLSSISLVRYLDGH